MSRMVDCYACGGVKLCTTCGEGRCHVCAGKGQRLAKSDTLPTGSPAAMAPARIDDASCDERYVGANKFPQTPYCGEETQ